MAGGRCSPMVDGVGLPGPGEVPAWHAPLSDLTGELTETWAHRHWSWTTGGCFAFSSAFLAAFGGEEYGLCSQDPEGDFPVEHAVVRLGDAYYDYNGLLDVEAEMDALARRTGRALTLKPRGEEGVFWFEDDFMDDEEMERLHATLAECVPAGSPKP